MTEPTFSSNDVCRLARITFRQLDYWERTGLISPSVPSRSRGSGHHRRWSRDDVVLVAALGQAGPSIRWVLAEAMRAAPGVKYVVIVGDWKVRVCGTDDELLVALHDEMWAVVVLVETLVVFDAAA